MGLGSIIDANDMIDRQGRDQYAEQLRHFAAGVLSVDEYERRTEELAYASSDPALAAVWRAAWALYDDFRTSRLRGEWALSRDQRREVARWLLFLYSDHEYQWPVERTGVFGCFLSAMSLGWWDYWNSRAQSQRQMQAGVLEYWPFRSRTHLEAACQQSEVFGERAV